MALAIEFLNSSGMSRYRRDINISFGINGYVCYYYAQLVYKSR